MGHRWTAQRTRVLTLGLLVMALCVTAGVPAHAEGDADLLEVSRVVPEFGGAYIDDGSLYIWLTKPSDQLRDKAKAELIDTVGADFDLDRVVALKATYTFEQLFGWHRAMIDVLSIEGVILTDIDDRSNRLTVTVEDPPNQEGAVVAELAASGVPKDAVTIVAGSPIRQTPSPSRSGFNVLLAIAAVVVAFLVGLFLRSRVGRRRMDTTTMVDQPELGSETVGPDAVSRN